MSNIEKLLNTPLEYLLTIETKENLENIKDENGLTVMHWAIVKRNIPKIKELLHAGKNISSVPLAASASRTFGVCPEDPCHSHHAD